MKIFRIIKDGVPSFFKSGKYFGYITLILLCFAFSCDGDLSTAEDFFYFERDNSQMPVWVKGNKNSNDILLLLHGGPGYTSANFVNYFKSFEDQYLVVYWDQRGSGASLGNIKDEDIKVDKFVEDTHILINILKKKYSDRGIFLLGHSWGGTLGTYYLTAHPTDNNVKGWIYVAGGHNNKTAKALSIDYVLKYAEEQINSNTDVTYWKEVKDWYNKNPKITAENISTHSGYVTKAKGYYHKKEFSDKSGADWFTQPNSLYAMAINSNKIPKLLPEIFDNDLTDKMSNITVPTIILWGKYDGTLPLPMAQDAYDAIGTSTSNKSIVIFEESAHYPFVEENEKFVTALKDFLNKYK